MRTYQMRLAMHCPGGSAWVFTEGAAAFRKITTFPGALPACTIKVCTERRIEVSHTKPDQGPNSDHLAFQIELELDVGGSVELGCDGPGKATAWFQLDGLPIRVACPPQFDFEPQKAVATRDGGNIKFVQQAAKAQGARAKKAPRRTRNS